MNEVDGATAVADQESFNIGEDEPTAAVSPSDFPSSSTAVLPAPPPPPLPPKPSAAAPPPPPAPASTNSELETAKRLLRTSKSKIEDLKSQVQRERQDAERARHDLQRFTIRSELDRQQRESEIHRLVEVNAKFQQFNVVSHDLQSEVQSLRKKFERLERERADLQADKQRLQQQLVGEQRQRGEQNQTIVQLKMALETAGPDALAQARLDIADELQDVKREFRLYKEQTERQLEDKDLEVQRAKTSSEASTELAYLRSVVLKYLASSNDVQAQNAMEAAIASVLRFNPEEVDFVREKRRSDAGWAVTLKSSIGL